MYFTSVYLLLTKRHIDFRWTCFYIAYGAILLALMTVYVVVNQYFGQLLWINYRNVPGGPPAWFQANFNNVLYVIGNAVADASNILGDALMLHRCYIIATRGWPIAIPCFLYLCTVGSCIATTAIAARPNGNIWAGIAVHLDIAWIASTVSFNVIVSSMICYRMIVIWLAHRDIIPQESLRTYTGVMSMIVEATLPFTILGIAYLVVQVCNSGTEAALDDVWSLFCSLSPQLIVLRISMGLGWSKNTLQQVTRTSRLGHWEVASPSTLSRSNIELHPYWKPNTSLTDRHPVLSPAGENTSAATTNTV